MAYKCMRYSPLVIDTRTNKFYTEINYNQCSLLVYQRCNLDNNITCNSVTALLTIRILNILFFYIMV